MLILFLLRLRLRLRHAHAPSRARPTTSPWMQQRLRPARFFHQNSFLCSVLLRLMLMCILMNVSYDDTIGNTEMKYKHMAHSHF